MAVYTHVDDEALSAFLNLYDVGGLLSAKGIAEGVENTNYLVRADRGTFILTLYEQRVNADDLPFFLNLMEHCADRGLTVPRPVHRRDGGLISKLCGRHAAMITFLDGVAARRPGPAQCGELGKGLAAFHNATASFAGQRDNALGPAAWAPLFDQSRDRADTVIPGLTHIVDAELQAISDEWPQKLPKGVIHADLFPDNAFFVRGALSGIIDFYFSCNDILAYDLAICLNAWCFEEDGSFNVTKSRAMTEGYASQRPLTADEIDALPILCRGSALRFLLTRLHDWLRVPEGAMVTPKDPAPYLKRLKFHQAVARPSEYGLAP